MSPEGPRFLADSMVGKLARLLRLLGYDARYERQMSDSRLVEVAGREDRWLLTRDRRLVRRRACRRYVLVDGDEPWEQLEQVVEALRLPVRDEDCFTRCLECNRELRQADREEVEGEVPDYVHGQHRRFARCPGCGRIYWQGTHVEGMQRRLQELAGSSPAGSDGPAGSLSADRGA